MDEVLKKLLARMQEILLGIGLRAGLNFVLDPETDPAVEIVSLADDDNIEVGVAVHETFGVVFYQPYWMEDGEVQVGYADTNMDVSIRTAIRMLVDKRIDRVESGSSQS